ncbi:MAG: peroxiredoxin family protein [Bryobacteraceae bacterium]
MKLLERFANLAVIVGVAVFLALVVHNRLWRSSAPPATPLAMAQALRGRTIHLSGIDFPRSRASVLLVISKTCHYCEESLPFYRTLAVETQGKVDLLAVLPQPRPEAEAYLKEVGLPATQVASAPPTQLGLSGTPTLVLLDRSGKVQEVWLGFLEGTRQAQVRSRLAQL